MINDLYVRASFVGRILGTNDNEHLDFDIIEGSSSWEKSYELANINE